MKRKILMQRITQMNVIPDVLPTIEPTLDVDLLWHKRIITPGDFVPSNWSENPPALRIQKFDKGEAKLTIVAVDSDVPNPETDSFESRCHGIWSNITISPTKTDAGTLKGKDVLPWSPPFAQKGSPYHRISLFIFEQPEGSTITAEQVKTFSQNAFSDDFSLRDFAEKSGFKAVGVTMFRTQWDETMKVVMERNGIPGADVEFRRKKPERLPEKDRVKDGLRYRGWRK
jgi:large subunit ribosomal protein L35